MWWYPFAVFCFKIQCTEFAYFHGIRGKLHFKCQYLACFIYEFFVLDSVAILLYGFERNTSIFPEMFVFLVLSFASAFEKSVRHAHQKYEIAWKSTIYLLYIDFAINLPIMSHHFLQSLSLSLRWMIWQWNASSTFSWFFFHCTHK